MTMDNFDDDYRIYGPEPEPELTPELIKELEEASELNSTPGGPF